MSQEPVTKAATQPIPGYQIERELGRGGMASVYLAVQQSLQRQVALKIMNPALSADEDFKRRFLNEGRIVGQLNHSNIVTVYDFGSHEHRHYLAMEYLPNGTLRERIQQGIPHDQAIAIARQLGQALAFAHQRGFIHRDIKPMNVLFREDGTAVLTDFGIAKAVGSSAQLTRTGYTFGSVGYMSPEQATGKPLDHRADIYSFGIMFWEMLTGKRPYESTDAFALALQHATAPLPKLPDELTDLQPLCERLLAKQPEDRFAGMEEFVAELDQLRPPPTGSQRTLSALTTGATVVLSGSAPATAAPQPAPGARPAPAGSRRTGLLAAAAVVVVLLLAGGGLYLWPRNTLKPATTTTTTTSGSSATAVPLATQVARLLTRADLQWGAGHFTQPDGDNAFATYQKILTLEPDNAQAHKRLLAIGRQRLISHYRDQAQQALANNQLDRSLAATRDALRLAPEDTALRLLAQQIGDRIAKHESWTTP